MEVPHRVHIVPFGFEEDRIVEPVVEQAADRVLLLDWLADDIERPPYHDDVLERLTAAGIDFELVDCELFDLYDSIAVVAEHATAEAEAGNNVFVNLATGSTITGIGAMIACMVTGAAQPYYVRGEHYSNDDEPVAHGVELTKELPTYPMDPPEPQHVAVLGYLVAQQHAVETGEQASYTVSKGDLIDFGKAEGLAFATEYEGESEKGYYRRLERHVLDPLAANGYVEIETVGRSKRVYPTDIGANTYRAFEYLR